VALAAIFDDEGDAIRCYFERNHRVFKVQSALFDYLMRDIRYPLVLVDVITGCILANYWLLHRASLTV